MLGYIHIFIVVAQSLYVHEMADIVLLDIDTAIFRVDCFEETVVLVVPVSKAHVVHRRTALRACPRHTQ